MTPNLMISDEQADRLRRTIRPTVEDWLRDYGLEWDKPHRQLVHRVVAAIAAMHQCGVLTVGPVTAVAQARPSGPHR